VHEHHKKAEEPQSVQVGEKYAWLCLRGFGVLLHRFQGFVTW